MAPTDEMYQDSQLTQTHNTSCIGARVAPVVKFHRPSKLGVSEMMVHLEKLNCVQELPRRSPEGADLKFFGPYDAAEFESILLELLTAESVENQSEAQGQSYDFEYWLVLESENLALIVTRFFHSQRKGSIFCTRTVMRTSINAFHYSE